jgi:hypothetical protein
LIGIVHFPINVAENLLRRWERTFVSELRGDFGFVLCFLIDFVRSFLVENSFFEELLPEEVDRIVFALVLLGCRSSASWAVGRTGGASVSNSSGSMLPR